MSTPPLPEREIRSHRDLLVWQRAMDFTDLAYGISDMLPQRELYGLGSQIRRACVSVPSNIAEGHGRHHLGDYLRSLSYSMGSVMELDTLGRIALRRGYITQDVLDRFLNALEEVGRMLRGLMRSLHNMRS